MANVLPWKTGAVLSATVAIGYSLCTAVFWLAPESAATFMNALFHGLDFRRLAAGPDLFTFGSFAYGLVVLSAWAFMLGAVFGLLSAWARLSDAPTTR